MKTTWKTWAGVGVIILIFILLFGHKAKQSTDTLSAPLSNSDNSGNEPALDSYNGQLLTPMNWQPATTDTGCGCAVETATLTIDQTALVQALTDQEKAFVEAYYNKINATIGDYINTSLSNATQYYSWFKYSGPITPLSNSAL